MTQDHPAARHPMARKDRERTREEAILIAQSAQFGVVSFLDPDSGAPMGLPVSPAVADDGTVYWHSSARHGLRRDALEACPRASVAFVAYARDVAADYSVDYASAVISGRVEIVEDPVERREAILLICSRHVGEDSLEKTEAYYEAASEKIIVWRLRPELITGKSRGWEVVRTKLDAS